MQKRLWRGTFAAITCAAAVGLAAQTGSSPPDTRSASDKITVTGCVQSADQARTGTSGAPSGSSSASTKFVLIASKSEPSSSTSATGTSGTSASAASKASTYRLDADDSKLSAHVGHKVAITGSLESSSASGSGASSSGATGGTSAYSSSSSGSNAPKLKVDSVTMIAPTCSE